MAKLILEMLLIQRKKHLTLSPLKMQILVENQLEIYHWKIY